MYSSYYQADQWLLDLIPLHLRYQLEASASHGLNATGDSFFYTNNSIMFGIKMAQK